MIKYLQILPSHFEIGGRIFDTQYKQIGIIYSIDDFAIQVAFPENISRHGGTLNYCRCYEVKFFIENSRLQVVDHNGKISNLETFFDL